MRKLLSNVLGSWIGLWIASLYIRGVVIVAYPTSSFFGFSLTSQWQVLLVLGVSLGLINYFLVPIIKFEIFTIAIDMAILWLLDIMFYELSITLWLPMLYTVLIIYALNIIINFFLTKHN